jgi:predicted CopG family antitoxin
MKTLSISIQEKTYQALKQQVGQRQISKFVDRLVTEELEKKRQKLIEGYKRVARSKARREEDKI